MDTKDQIKIGTIGHHHDGKVTLTEAITKILSQNNCTLVDNYSIDKEDTIKRVTINTRHLSYQIQNQKRHIDDEQFDASIILVSPDLMFKAREDIFLSRQKVIPKLALLIDSSSKIEDKELLELDLRTLLDEYGYNGEETIVSYVNVDELLAGNIGQDVGIINDMQAILKSLDKKREVPAPGPYILPSRSWDPTHVPTIKRKDKKEKQRPPIVKTKNNQIYQRRINRSGRHN